MSLDGLRAWIGEVERKLGMRTRVFLVLAVIAIGGAGAAVYLAIDTRENAVSESDVQALQEKLEARIRAVGAAAAVAPEPAPEVEPEAAAPEGGQPKPEAEGAQPEAEPEAKQPEQGAAGGAGGGSPKGAANGGSANKGGKKSLAELLRQTREANEKAEREAGGQK